MDVEGKEKQRKKNYISFKQIKTQEIKIWVDYL